MVEWCSRTKWLWVPVQLQSLKLQISRLLWARSSLTFRKIIECRFTLKRIRDMTRPYIQNKLFKTLHYWSRDMLNFLFFRKDLEIASPEHFVCDFLTEMFRMLYSINWPNFIVWLPLLLEILGNMFIEVVNQVLRHKFQNYPDLSNQAVFINDWKVKTKT